MNADDRGWPQLKSAWAGIVLVLGVATSALAATPIPDGRWRFQFVDTRGQPDRPLDVYTYRPRRCDSKCPIVFVMAGVKRNAAEYRGYWELKADKYQVIVIAPAFTQRAWPKAAGYNLGAMADQPDREKWAYSAI